MAISSGRDIETALVDLRQAIRERYGREALTVRVQLHDGSKISLPFPVSASPEIADTSPAGEQFIPSPFQLAILEALEGRAMRTDALGAAVNDRSRLYKPGGLKELRDRGLVQHNDRVGFYRPDAPPDELL